jgi:hypothetical protein
MNPLDGHAEIAAMHRRDMERAAARHRLARSVHRGSSPVLRLYARIWWASRPRVDAWGPPPAARSGLTA